MKKGILETISWLEEPAETQAERKSFCAKVVTARPTIEKLIKRMLGGIARDYYGKVRAESEQQFVNGMIAFGEEVLNQVVMLEGEQEEQNKPKEVEPANSGSVL